MTDNHFLWEYDEALGFEGLCGIDEVWCCPEDWNCLPSTTPKR